MPIEDDRDWGRRIWRECVDQESLAVLRDDVLLSIETDDAARDARLEQRCGRAGIK